MQDFMDAVIFGLKEILHRSTMKFAMVSGIIVSLFWVFVGFIFWNDLVTFSSSILSMLPFSMLRSNGAWMLSTFLWLQLVLVTFALIFSFFGNIIVEKMNKERYTNFSFIIGIFSAGFWSVVWFEKGDYIYAQLLKLLTWLPFETIEKGLSFLIAFYFIYSAIIVTLIFVTSISSMHFLSEIKEQHFPYDRMHDEYEHSAITKTLRDTGIFLLASVVSFPLLFVPVVNFVILVALWVWLMKDTLASDTAAFVFGDTYQERLKEHQAALWGLSLIGSLFNFIPVFNLFGPYFTELAMLHYLKNKRG
jgi:hypothetical protein